MIRLTVAFAISFVMRTSLPATGAEGVRDRPRIHLVMDECVGIEREALVEILSAEVGPIDAVGGTGKTDVKLTCESPWIRVSLGRPDKTDGLSRRVDPSLEHPRARLRLIALAIAELVTASESELAPVAPVEVTLRSKPLPTTEPRDVLDAGDHPVSLIGIARRFSKGEFLRGGGIAMESGTERRIGFIADLVAESNQQAFSTGTTRATLLSTAVAASLHLRRGDRFRLQVRVGPRIGYGWLSGTPNAPTIRGGSVRSVWGGPWAGAFVSTRIFRGIQASAGADLGYAAYTLRGDVDDGAVMISGAWLALQVGIGWTQW